MHYHRNLKQTATYWAPTGVKDMYGTQTYTRTELPCRWEGKAESILSKTGDETISKAKVFLAEDVDLNGYLLLGTSTEDNPTAVPEAREIRQIAQIPDLRNMKTLYVAWL